jgi:hypothetical protein
MTEFRQTTGPNGPDPSPPPPWDEWGARLGGHGPAAQRPLPDLSPLFALLDALRRMVPAELQHQFNALQRELLLTMRALIDWYLERLDARHRAPQVEDIPID